MTLHLSFKVMVSSLALLLELSCDPTSFSSDLFLK